jgi:hypothetical protein
LTRECFHLQALFRGVPGHFFNLFRLVPANANTCKVDPVILTMKEVALLATSSQTQLLPDRGIVRLSTVHDGSPGRVSSVVGLKQLIWKGRSVQNGFCAFRNHNMNMFYTMMMMTRSIKHMYRRGELQYFTSRYTARRTAFWPFNKLFLRCFVGSASTVTRYRCHCHRHYYWRNRTTTDLFVEFMTSIGIP